MHASVNAVPGGGYEVVLEDHPPNAHALPMAPLQAEPELRSGLWLLLLVAVWSAPDRNMIRIALELAKDFEGRIQVGIRPFDDHRETSVWCDAVEERYRSPIWVLLRDGVKLDEKVGIHRQPDLKEWILRCGQIDPTDRSLT